MILRVINESFMHSDARMTNPSLALRSKDSENRVDGKNYHSFFE